MKNKSNFIVIGSFKEVVLNGKSLIAATILNTCKTYEDAITSIGDVLSGSIKYDSILISAMNTDVEPKKTWNYKLDDIEGGYYLSYEEDLSDSMLNFLINKIN